MTQNAFIAISGMFSIIWKFMCQNIPGTTITFAAAFCGLMFIPIVFKFIQGVTGMNGTTSEALRTASTIKHAKVNK